MEISPTRPADPPSPRTNPEPRPAGTPPFRALLQRRPPQGPPAQCPAAGAGAAPGPSPFAPEGTLASRTRTNDAPPTPELRDKRPRCDDDRACLETAFNPCMPALLPPPHVTPVAATTAPHPVADANAMLADFVSYLRVGRSARGHAVDLKVGAGRAAGLRVRLESDGNAIDAVLDADDAHPEDVRHVRDALERGLSARGLTLRSIEVRGE